MNIEETLHMNAVVSIVVTLAALLAFWFICRQNDVPGFVVRSGFLWLLSWLVWVATWLAIGSNALQGWPHVVSLELLCSDLNSILFLLLYFMVTRAESSKEVARRVLAIVVPLALGYALVYWIFDIDLARSLHQRWSLALAAATPVLVGWAIAVRYRGYLPLIVGFVYGFLQPAAFEAVFPNAKYPPAQMALLAKALVVLAILKVVWALVIGRYLMSVPERTEPISYVKAATYELGFILEAPATFFAYAALLVGGLLVGYFLTRPVNLTQFGSLVTIIIGATTGVKALLRWRETRKAGNILPTAG
jgi:hypothetical protein